MIAWCIRNVLVRKLDYALAICPYSKPQNRFNFAGGKCIELYIIQKQ